VCPVGAIEIVMAPPTMTADLPVMTSERETNIPNLFVAGELSGLALIKNAVAQGQECIDVLARRLPSLRRRLGQIGKAVDVVIVGAGPAGLSASLRRREPASSITLEAEDSANGPCTRGRSWSDQPDDPRPGAAQEAPVPGRRTCSRSGEGSGQGRPAGQTSGSSTTGPMGFPLQTPKAAYRAPPWYWPGRRVTAQAGRSAEPA
jgi:hypothetical protein